MTADLREPAASAVESQLATRGAPIRFRAMLLGLLLVPPNAYWVILAELRWANIMTLNPLFVAPVFNLFFLMLINVLLKRAAPRLAFRPAELVLIYVMLVMTCCVASHDYLINLMGVMPWPRWGANDQNQWETLMFPHLARWLFVWDKELLEGCFKGNSSIWEPRVLRMWMTPLAVWTGFIVLVGWMMMCLNVLLRKAWMDNTRLSFPIVRLPLALTDDGSREPMLKTSQFWMGAGLAMLLGLTNGLSEWYANVPHLPTRTLWMVFPNLPWSVISPFSISFYPFIVGLAFLVPLDISFSLWFFFLLFRAQMVLGWRYGQGSIYDYSFVSQQATGAWYAFGIYLVYSSRGYLARVVRTALGGRGEGDAGEPFSYRVAFWGFLASCAAFALFWHAAGMSGGWVVLVLVTFVLLALCFTRIRAEAGSVHETWDLEPMHLFRFLDSRTLGPANLSVAAVQHWFWRLGRTHMMPNQLEAFKLAQEHRVSLRSFVLPMMAALLLATVSGMWACLDVFYRDGAQAKCLGFPAWTTYESIDTLGNTLLAGQRAATGWFLPCGSAVLFVAFLAWMRTRFVWFPFHPFGYCLGPLMHLYWFPFLMAWAAKLVILRYGGLKLYRSAIPFFLGLVLGDYLIGGAWSLIGIIWQLPVYGVFK